MFVKLIHALRQNWKLCKLYGVKCLYNTSMCESNVWILSIKSKFIQFVVIMQEKSKEIIKINGLAILLLQSCTKFAHFIYGLPMKKKYFSQIIFNIFSVLSRLLERCVFEMTGNLILKPMGSPDAWWAHMSIYIWFTSRTIQTIRRPTWENSHSPYRTNIKKPYVWSQKLFVCLFHVNLKVENSASVE